MEHRTLEIHVMSAKDLNKVNLITKMDVYVVVQISGDDKSKQKAKTPVDKDGDSNPTWNFPMKFTIDEAAAQQNRLTLGFQLKCERALGDKDIGEVHVPIKELLQSGEALDGKQQFVSYQVRKPSGKPKGQMSFGYKFGEKVAAKVANLDQPMMAYPAPSTHMVGSSSVYPPPPPHDVGKSESYPPPSSVYPPPPPHGAGKSESYPPPIEGGYHHQAHPPPPVHAAPPAGYAYPPPPQPAGYGYPPPPTYGGYPPPPAPGYGYPPQPGYGYPPQPGYGYPPVQQQPPKKNSKLGLGLGAGLLGGALGGMLIGDMVSDAGFDDGGFDF